MPPAQNNQPAINPQWAWQPYAPTAQNPWDIKKAGHLFRRLAFGATHDELQRAVNDGVGPTINRLLQGGGGQEAFERDSNSRIAGIRDFNNDQQLTAWWLHRMLYSPHPAREKLTLFWHNHFATSNVKVINAGYMIGQYQLMRRHAQGSFRDMLMAMHEDPAMIIWLDIQDSRRGQPNENYGRELMELFSLGIFNYENPNQANYTEEDIREAARAFTGYTIQNDQGVFIESQHDNTEKNVLGQRGNWRGPDIVRICLEQPSCAFFIVDKLYRFLVSETMEPTPQLLAPLATQFRQSNYDFGALVNRIVRSNLFFSPRVYRSKIKSPVEYAIGMARSLESNIGTTQLVQILESLGQRPFYPPSVAGWDGGRAWLNGQTLLFRHNLALALTSTEDNRFFSRADPARLAREHNRQTDPQVLDFYLRLFLQNDVPAMSRQRLQQYLRQANSTAVPEWLSQDAADQRTRSLCHLVLTLPEFQLC